jgi:hypothetical protein
MLEQFSDRIRLCYERAADAKERADATNEPAIKAEFLAAEKRWLTLARSYGFAESLEAFTRANSERRRTFDEHLRRSSLIAGGGAKTSMGRTTYSNSMKSARYPFRRATSTLCITVCSMLP